jgi:predicted transcriptional regulator
MNTSHKVRALILYELRHRQTARFSELMKQSGLESDSFKFHIRALVEQGYIQKTSDMSYSLTPAGKESANNLDQDRSRSLKQPKVSLLIVLSRNNAENQLEYLVQQRLRQPFYGYWGCMSGPAQWGADFEETARQEIAKQCGITGIECGVHSFHRQKDYDGAGNLLEDKLFIVITASVGRNIELKGWPYGHNTWMTMAEFTRQEKAFQASAKAIWSVNNLAASATYTSDTVVYSAKDY